MSNKHSDMIATHWDTIREQADEIKRLLECLTALTEADGKEIGSYRKETGLRGELKNKDAELDAYEARIAKLEGALREIISDELYNEAQMCLIAKAALQEDKP
jgi:hypothetical protein